MTLCVLAKVNCMTLCVLAKVNCMTLCVLAKVNCTSHSLSLWSSKSLEREVMSNAREVMSNEVMSNEVMSNAR